MPNRLFNLSDWQWQYFLDLSALTGLSMNELNRRLYDRFLTPQHLNEIVPSFSGQIRIER